METSIEDNIFELLGTAKKLEESQNNTEAATKYYEAVYLMKSFVNRLPQTPEEEPKRALFLQQIAHFQQLASTLISASEPNNVPVAKAVRVDDDHAVFLGQRIIHDDENVTPNALYQSPNTLRGSMAASQTHIKTVIADIHKLVNQGNCKLALALNRDEMLSKNKNQSSFDNVISPYMSAAELYLQALQLGEPISTNNPEVQRVVLALKRRLQSTLDRVEQLKSHELRRSKIVLPWNNSRQNPRSSLTKKEIEVLKQSSLTVAGLFLPWSDAEADALNVEASQAAKQSKSIQLFTDPDGFLKLNEKQAKVFHQWARPDEIVKLRHQSGLKKGNLQSPVLLHTVTPYTIKQQFVTDCSFIAGLCVTAALERRMHAPVVTNSIYPQTENQQPVYSPAGKYMVKLWLNGVARSVVIDDFLPIDKKGNLLCSHTTDPSANELELWVCLFEKAYMKLCGGYDFPGSNSGVDLFALTGWIPERVHFPKRSDDVRDFETPPERAWERISSASSFGDCVFTVSSHLNLSEDEAEKLGLVTGHAYAVLNVIETKGGQRLLLLKNPWANKGWKGRFSPHDSIWNDNTLRNEVGYDARDAQGKDDGVFYIAWEDVLKYFQNVHFSWNPFLFKYKTTTHAIWLKDDGPFDDTFNVGENPQYILELSDQAIQKKSSVWVLVARHVNKQEQAGAEASDYLTVHIHRNQGKRERIWYGGPSGNCVLTGAYTNNPTVLVRYDVDDATDKHLSLVLSQYQKSNDLRYTISVYCTEKFSLSTPRADLHHVIEQTGKFSSQGGPLGTHQSHANPMFAVKVTKQDTEVELSASASKSLAINVLLVPVAQLGHKMSQAIATAVIDSGKYRHGFLFTDRKSIPAGNYALIVNPYTCGVTGPFQLKCFSSKPVEIHPLQ